LGLPLTQARLQRISETGRFATINELAAAEKINSSYVSRVLRLTLLAPDIVEAILHGRQPEGMTLPGLMRPLQTEWGGYAATIDTGERPARFIDQVRKCPFQEKSIR
jgi:hypothetical protein